MKGITLQQGVLFGGLALLMALTRYHHFGDASHLPDASLAVFFLAGAFVGSAIFFPLLLLEAGLIDYLAMTVGGVSDWCFSPAYWFLIPTYACVWFGGRWAAKGHAVTFRTLVAHFAAFVLTVSVAFLISNGSFYALSSRFPDMSMMEYALRVAQYYPPYVMNAVAYVVAAYIGALAWRQLRKSREPAVFSK